MRELLAAVAVAGILFALLLPGIFGGPKGLAARAAEQSRAALLAKAYVHYTIAGGGAPQTLQPFSPATAGSHSSSAHVAQTINDVAFMLARFGSANDAKLWFSVNEAALHGRIPAQVIEGNVATATEVSPAFKAAGPKAWAFVVGLPAAAPDVTPLLWTYGLQPDGRWAKNSPWKGEGGIIAFCDTHVVWLEAVDPALPDVGAQLFPYPGNPNRDRPIVNIFEAIPHTGPSRAQVLNANGEGR